MNLEARRGGSNHWQLIGNEWMLNNHEQSGHHTVVRYSLERQHTIRGIRYYDTNSACRTKTKSAEVIQGSSECCLAPLVETKANNPWAPLQRKKNQKMKTTPPKENVLHKMTSLHFSSFLQRRYDRQNALFKEQHNEIGV